MTKSYEYIIPIKAILPVGEILVPELIELCGGINVEGEFIEISFETAEMQTEEKLAEFNKSTVPDIQQTLDKQVEKLDLKTGVKLKVYPARFKFEILR